MGEQTAFARATTRLPSTKPILRQFQDAMRLAVNRPEPDGRKRIIHLAEKLSDLAMEGDVAAMREVMYCLDGKPGIAGAEDGATTVSFVVRLPMQLDADQWQAMMAPKHPAKPLEPMTIEASALDAALIQDITDSPWDHHQGELLSSTVTSGKGHLDSVHEQSVSEPVRYYDTAPPLAPIAAPEPLVPGAGHTIAGAESA